ncbi:MAG TPA: HAD hydrolase-like protein [Accumulibacter sp.]|nr:HAD hydrolase-like protein [Accumulibacter sp.]HPP45868.1 HAD hydrolase-like protein [Accumulibacter sp.]
MNTAILFDLDGTLIDSRPAIIDTFAAVLHKHCIEPRVPWPALRIGPPLAVTLRELAGGVDAALLEALIADFKASYDRSGYRTSRVFDGIAELLAALHADGRACYLATNKRLHPTRLILDHLGWQRYFIDVYALDRLSPPLPDKAAMLRRLLADQQLATHSSLYVGDTPEDQQAASAAGLAFIGVEWGYGHFPDEQTVRVATPQELLAGLRRFDPESPSPAPAAR